MRPGTHAPRVGGFSCGTSCGAGAGASADEPPEGQARDVSPTHASWRNRLKPSWDQGLPCRFVATTMAGQVCYITGDNMAAFVVVKEAISAREGARVRVHVLPLALLVLLLVHIVLVVYVSLVVRMRLAVRLVQPVLHVLGMCVVLDMIEAPVVATVLNVHTVLVMHAPRAVREQLDVCGTHVV